MKKGNIVALIVVLAVIVMTLGSIIFIRRNKNATVNLKDVVKLTSEDAQLKKIETEMGKELPEIDESLDGDTTTGSTAPGATIDIDKDIENIDLNMNTTLPDISTDL